MTTIQSACVKYLMEIEHKHAETLSTATNMEWGGIEVFFVLNM
jgi:hypothetical protein